MIDPVSAIGVAAAAAQFLTFSLDALDWCLQIREDVDGATKANKELEVRNKDINDIVKELRALTKGDELKKLLEDVRGAGRSKALPTAKATFKALKANRNIEKLKNALKEKQMLLDTALTHDIRERVDLLAIEQSKGFVDLDDRIKEFIKALQSQQAAAATSSKDFEASISKISDQGTRIEHSLEKSREVIRGDVAGLHQRIDSRFNDLNLRDAKEDLLTTLFYPEHAARREMMKPPWQNTFNWVFDRTNEASTDGEESAGDEIFAIVPETWRQWSCFPRWLREGTGVYWISGKAGSGKSTLMAHIVSEDATRRELSSWSAGMPLHVISFFFWLPGSVLQKSIQGLLRSILYQILNEIPGAAEDIVAKYPLPRGRIPEWSETRLRKLLELALDTSQALGRCFCIFIDGLDEFHGDVEELLQLSAGNSVGRSTVPCARLRLEDLNYQDISKFVRGKLEAYDFEEKVKRNICSEISSGAKGVFLWAALTVRSITKGIASADIAAVLRKRLKAIPSDMNELFAKMLDDIDDVHKKAFAFYLKSMLLFARMQDRFQSSGGLKRSPHLALLTASRGEEDPVNYELFVESCAKTEKEIIACSGGILEIEDTYRDLRAVRGWEAQFHVPQGKERQRRILSTNTPQLRLEVLRHRCAANHVKTLPFWRHVNSNMTWIHRSAYDFIFNSDCENTKSLLSLVEELEVAEALAKGALKLFVTLPSSKLTSNEDMFTFHDRLSNTTSLIAGLAKETSASLWRFVDELRDLLIYCMTEELWVNGKREENTKGSHCNSNITESGYFEKQLHYLRMFFWIDCIDPVRDDCYVNSNLTRIAEYHSGLAAISELISCHGDLAILKCLQKRYITPFETWRTGVKTPFELYVSTTIFMHDLCAISWQPFMEICGICPSWIEQEAIPSLVWSLALYDGLCKPSCESILPSPPSVLHRLCSILNAWKVYIALEASPQLHGKSELNANSTISASSGMVETQDLESLKFPGEEEDSESSYFYHKIILQGSPSAHVQLQVMPNTCCDAHKSNLKEAIRRFDPKFRVLFNTYISTAYINDPRTVWGEYTTDSEKPMLQQAYDLDQSWSKRIVDDFETGLDSILEDLEKHIESNPHQPVGMTRVQYGGPIASQDLVWNYN